MQRELARGGPEGALRYEKSVAPNKEELQLVLLQRAKEQLEQELRAKEEAIQQRAKKLEAEMEAKIEEEKRNGGRLAFSAKTDVLVTKTPRELLVQARREIEQEWSSARILEQSDKKKDRPDNIIARQEAREARQRTKWVHQKQRTQRE